MEKIFIVVSTLKDSIEECADQMLVDTPAQGLSLTQVHVLGALYENDKCRASDLARAICKPATSFTPILDGIQDRNFIIRIPDPNDRRAVRIHLTAKGEALRPVIMRVLDQIEQSFG